MPGRSAHACHAGAESDALQRPSRHAPADGTAAVLYHSRDRLGWREIRRSVQERIDTAGNSNLASSHDHRRSSFYHSESGNDQIDPGARDDFGLTGHSLDPLSGKPGTDED